MNFETFKDLTRIEHTLFGLPFTLSGALLALLIGSFSWMGLMWIFLAFLAARISGMAFNQLIDRTIDAKNPRTKNRALPTGRATVFQARILAIGSLIVFWLVAAQINFICFLLAPLAAFLIAIYSYMKRVHLICHFVLGLIHFLAPIMAFAALTNTISLASIFLGFASFSLISGNDIVYAIHDMQFDRTYHLHSFPARYGIEKSLLFSRYLHIFCVLFLILVGLAGHFPYLYYGAPVVCGFIFYHFHMKVLQQFKKMGTIRGIESVFFFSNVSVSFASFLFVLLSVLWADLL